MVQSCVFTVGFLQTYPPLIKWDLLIENKKFLTKVPWLIWCGLILKTLKHGKEMPEVQGGFSATKLSITSIYWTALSWLSERISWFNRDTFTGSTKSLSLYGRHQIIATEWITKRLYSIWTKKAIRALSSMKLCPKVKTANITEISFLTFCEDMIFCISFLIDSLSTFQWFLWKNRN